MARSCKGLKLPVNSDKIRTNYVRAVNIRHLVSNGGWGGGLPYMSIYIHTYEYVALADSICIYAVPP